MSDIIEDLDKFRIIYGLKQVYRFNTVGNRKESVPEHVFSALMLADFFMSEFDFKVDKQKVFDMILYHDLVELYAGDTPLHPKIRAEHQAEQRTRERLAADKLFNNLPEKLSKRYKLIFIEFEERKTREAKLAKAIEQLDAEFHELDYKNDWHGWTEEFLKSKKAPYFEDFPELKEMFEKHLKYCRENGYFDQ